MKVLAKTPERVLSDSLRDTAQPSIHARRQHCLLLSIDKTSLKDLV